MADARGKLPSLNGLKVFEAAARHLNFRLAAEELGVTQGAVSQQIRGLEAELGVMLFDRLPRTLVLTGEGRSYIADIRRAVEIIAQATHDLRPEPVQLTISVTPTFASKWLIPLLPDFVAQNPDLGLHILATERISSFPTDGVDLAIRYGNPPFGPGLTADLLFEQEIIAVCSPGLIPEKITPKTAEELTRYTLLHDVHNFWPEFIEKHLAGGNRSWFKSIIFSQTLHAVEAAIAGQGLALASRYFVSRDIEECRLRRLFKGSLRGRSDVYFVKPRYRKSEAVDKLQAWMTSKVRESRDGRGI